MNTQPTLFRDGKAHKWWIACNGDIDGPFDSEADAQPAMDRLNAAAEKQETADV